VTVTFLPIDCTQHRMGAQRKASPFFAKIVRSLTFFIC
jgi:hypothetical protein